MDAAARPARREPSTSARVRSLFRMVYSRRLLDQKVEPQHRNGHADLLTFLFGNSHVSDDALIFADALDESLRLTKADVRVLTRKLIAGFRRGLAAHGAFTVCCHAFNSIWYPIFFYGIIGAGGIFTGSNPSYTPAELVHHFTISKTSVVFTDAEQLPSVLEATRQCGIPDDRVFVTSTLDEQAAGPCRSWQVLLQHGELDWGSLQSSEGAQTTLAGLFSTSGTTGLPKMAMRSHQNLICECAALDDSLQKPFQVSRLLSTPFFHLFTVPLALTTSLYYGIPVYVMRRFHYDTFLRVVAEHQITETTVVPPIIKKFLMNARPEQGEQLKSLQTIYCGGAPLDPASQEKALQHLSAGARVVQVYGMTESGWITTTKYPEVDRSGSVGRPISDHQIRIVDSHGRPVAPGEKGELHVKGSLVMPGYFENPSATASAMDRNGWLHTGDMACMRHGKVFIVDRLKDLVKLRGWQVSPSELEAVLLLHPAVADAAVIGITPPDAESEIPRAYLVCSSSSSSPSSSPPPPPSPRDLQAFMSLRLAKYKWQDCEFRFVESIPKSVSGKILKKILVAEASKEMQDNEEEQQQASLGTTMPSTKDKSVVSVVVQGLADASVSERTLPDLAVVAAAVGA